MLGAIAGDIIGSVFECRPIKTTNFPLFNENSSFTDDTVLTIAVAKSILTNKNYRNVIKEYGCKYPDAGYGAGFYLWLYSRESKPYNSYGNGSAMRVSPIGFAFDTIDEVLYQAKKSAEITHNHPEGIKGAQATAAAVFLSARGQSKLYIKSFISEKFHYNLDKTIDQIRSEYGFDISCQGSVPEAIVAFLESNSYIDAVRKSISLGGDSDTQACITGGIAHAYYKDIPSEIIEQVKRRLPVDFWQILIEFSSRYNIVPELHSYI